MTFYAGSVAACRAQATGDLAPVLRMGIDLQPGCGAVTLEADVAVGVACLAGGEVLSRLPRMGR